MKPHGAAQVACIDKVVLRIVPGILQSFSLSRTDTVGGAPDQQVMGTVTLQDPAGPEGVQVSISQDLPHDAEPAGRYCMDQPELGFNAATTAARAVKAYSVPVKAPSSVLVKPGNRSENFKIETSCDGPGRIFK